MADLIERLGLPADWSRGDVTLSAASLGDAAPALDPWGGSLGLTGARLVDGDPAAALVIEGTGPLLAGPWLEPFAGAVVALADRALRVEADEVGGELHLAVIAALSPADVAGVLPRLPLLPAEGRRTRRHLLDLLGRHGPLDGLAIVSQSHPDARPRRRGDVDGVQLAAGVNLVARTTPSADSDLVAGWDGIGTGVTIQGPLMFDPTDDPAPLADDQLPWDDDVAIGRLTIRADLTDHLAGLIGLGDLADAGRVALVGYTPIDDDVAATAPRYWPQLALEVDLDLGAGSGPGGVEASGRFVLPLVGWHDGPRLIGRFESLSLADALAVLAGTDPTSILPDEVDDVLGAVEIDRATLGLRSLDDLTVTDVGLGCAFGPAGDGARWAVVPDSIIVGLDRLDVTVVDPTGDDPLVIGAIAGTVEVWGAVFDVEVSTPGFVVAGGLREGSTLELDRAFQAVLGIPAPVEVAIVGAEFTADKLGAYALSVVLDDAADDAGGLPELRLTLTSDGWSLAAEAEEETDGLTLATVLTALADLVPTLGPADPPAGADAFGITGFALSYDDASDTTTIEATCRLDLGDIADDELTAVLVGQRSSTAWSFRGDLDAASLDLGRLLTSAVAEAGGAIDVPDGARLVSASISIGHDGEADGPDGGGRGDDAGSADVHLGLRADADGIDVWLDLWRQGSTWRPLVQVGGADLPADIPVPDAIGTMLEETTIRWAGGSSILPSAPRLGTTAGPVHPGLSMLTVLPFEETIIGKLLALPDSPVPIEVAAGRLDLEIEHDLLAGTRVDLDAIVLTALLMRFRTPAEVGLQLGCDLHLAIGDVTADLRFAGAVTADLTKGDVLLQVAFLGAISHGETVPWKDPFGFHGLTVGAMELSIGPSIRALRGAVRAGKASLDVEAIWDQKDPTMSAVRFNAVSLTLQDLLDGFIGAEAPQLPGPLGQTGFEMLELDYAAGDFTFDWLTGPRTYRKGLKGAARVNLFGLEAAAVFDLEERQLAGSIAPLALGSLLTLEATRTAPTPPPWAAGFSDLGGPYVTLGLGENPSGDINGKITVFGVLSTEVDGHFDDTGMRLRVVQEHRTPIVRTKTDLLLGFGNRNGVPDIAFSGSLSLDVTFNPRQLANDILGIDIPWLDVDLLDIGVAVEASARISGDAISGSFGASFVLWGKRIGFRIAASLDLDLDAIGAKALEAVKDAALEAFRFFERLGEAIVEAVTAVVDAIVEVGEAIVEAFEAIADAVAAVAKAFEDLGKAIADLADAAWSEVSSWFGDDSAKRAREQRKLAAERRHRKLQAEEEAKRRAARELERQRQLLLLDAVDNLADGAMFDDSYLTSVQARIDASDRTRINPFTQTPEWNAWAFRAHHNQTWQDALGRARKRRHLRETYESAMSAAGLRIQELELSVKRAEDDLTAARERQAAAETTLADLQARRKRVLAALRGATDLVLDAREGAVKVEIALDTAEALQDRLRADADDLEGDAERLTALAGAGPIATGDWDEAEGNLATALELAEGEATEAEDLVRRAETRLANVQAELTLIRDSRASLTLARLDAVQRSVGMELTGIAAFGEWVDACREAGSPALVNLTSLRPEAEQLLQSLPTMVTAAASQALLEAEQVEIDHLTARPSVGTVAESVAFPGATVAAQVEAGLGHADRFLDGWALTPSHVDRGGSALVPIPDFDPPDLGLPAVTIDADATLTWSDTAPVAWAVAEGVRPDDWAARIEPLIEALIARWSERRQNGIQLDEAELRIEAAAALIRENERAELITRRQRGQRLLKEQTDRSDLIVHLLRGADGQVGYDYRTSSDEPYEWRTTADTTLRGRARDEGDHLIVHRRSAAGVRKYWARVPYESVARIAPWNPQEEFWAAWGTVTDAIARAVTKATAETTAILPSQVAMARATRERTTLTANGVLAEQAVVDAIDDLTGAQRRWTSERLAGPAVAVAMLDALLDDDRPLDQLAAVPTDPGQARSAQAAKVDAIDRLRRTVADLALLGGHEHGPAVVDEEQLVRLVRWTESVAAHGDVVRRLLDAVDEAEVDLDQLAADIGRRWRGEVLGLVGANGAVVGAEARAAVETAVDGAVAAADAAAQFDPGLAGLAELTAELRERLADKRSQIDAALDRIGELAVGDTADLQRQLTGLERQVNRSRTIVDRVDDVLAKVRDDLEAQKTRTHDPETLAALERMRLTVASSRDQRLLRVVVARARAVAARIDDLGQAVEPVEGRFAEIAALLDDVEEDAPSLAAGLDAVEAEFGAVGERAAAIAAELPELLADVLALVATIREKQAELVERQRAVFAAVVRVAVSVDRLIVEWERLGLATGVLAARTAPALVADTADTADVRHAGEVTAAVDVRLADLVNADAAQSELADRLRAELVDAAARLAIGDPTARAALEQARRAADDREREAAGPPQRLVPPAAMATAPVERGRPWSAGESGGGPGEDLLGPNPLADGYTVAFRLRVRRLTSGTTSLLDGQLRLGLRGRSLVVTLPEGPGGRRTQLRGRVEVGPINDVAIVVDRDRQLVLWVNGVPVGHAPAPVPAAPSADDLLGPDRRPDRGGPALADLRCWARALTAEEVLVARRHGPDPAEVDLLALRQPEVLGPFGPAPSTRPGVPDGAVLVRTPRGDLVVRHELPDLPWDAELVAVGRDAGVAVFGETDFEGADVEYFVDRSGIDLMGVRSLRVLSLTPSLDAKHWALEVVADDGTASLVAVDHDATGDLTTTDRVETVALFDLATTGRRSGRDRGLSIRSTYNRALLALIDGARCAPADTADPIAAGSLAAGRDPVLLAGTATASGADGTADDSAAGAADNTVGEDEATWLATGVGGPRLVGPEAVTSVNLFLTPVTGSRAYTLLRWHDDQRRYRLVVLLDRLSLVADGTEVVAVSTSLASGRSVHVRVEPGAEPAIRVEPARRPASSSESAGVPLVDGDGTRVGIWHRLMVNRPTTRPRPSRRSGSAATRPPAVDIPFAGDRRIRVGASIDPYHDDPGTGTAGGSFTGARPVALDGEVTVSTWVRPIAPSRSGARPGAWTALALVGADGNPVLRLGRDRSAARPVVEYLGRPVAVSDAARAGTDLPDLPADRWSHVAIRVARRGRTTRLTVLVDGETVVDRRVTALGRRAVSCTAGDARCAVNHVLLWDRSVDDLDLHRHLLRPSLPERPLPVLSWRLDGDGDADGVIRGQNGVAAVFVDDRRRLVAAGPHPLTDLLPERPPQSGEPELIARPAGERHGRPTFHLAQVDGGRRRWLRWSPEEGFTTTVRSRLASEVALRAFVGDRLDLNSTWLWYRLYGAAAEEPAELAASFDYPPATGAIAARSRTWDEALRRALADEVADAGQLRRAEAQAAAHAEALLAAAWIDTDLPTDDLAAARARVAEIGRANDHRFSGLRFGPGQSGPVELDGLAEAGSAVTLTYWVAGDLDEPSGTVVAHRRPGEPGLVVRHLPAGAADGGPAVAVTVGTETVTLDAGVDRDWHHVALTWRAEDGRLRLRIDGGRPARATVGVGVSLAPGRLTIGGDPTSGEGFVGRVEQVALWPEERSVGRQRQDRQSGPAPTVVEVELATPSTVGRSQPDPASAATDPATIPAADGPSAPATDEPVWLLTERAGAVVEPDGIEVGARRPLGNTVPVEFGTTPLVDRLAHWEQLVAGASTADDPVTALIEAIGRKPHRLGLRVDDVHRALAAADVRPTRPALDWSLAVWAHALARFEPAEGLTVRARWEALSRVGIEVRATIASGARRLGEALGAAAPADRAEAARTLGWYVVDPGDTSALTAAGRDDLAKLTGGVSTRRDLQARHLGLEPMWEPLQEPAERRREAVIEALAVLDAVVDPRPTPDELRARIHLDLLLLTPLLDGRPDDWLVRTLRQGW